MSSLFQVLGTSL